MNAPASVSVIIVTWNCAGDIARCLQSLSVEQGLIGEVALIDNASTDWTVKLVEQQFPQVRVIRHRENLGYAAAVNQGLREVSGELVLLLNPDAWVKEAGLRPLLDYLHKHSDVGACAPRLLFPDGRFQASCRRFPTVGRLLIEASGLGLILPFLSHWRWKLSEKEHQEGPVDQPMTSVFLLKRRTMNQTGLFDESFPIFFNDVDYCRRIWIAGFSIAYVPQAQWYHRLGGATGQRKFRMTFVSHRSFFRYFWKHASLIGRLGLVLLWPFFWLLLFPRLLAAVFVQPD